MFETFAGIGAQHKAISNIKRGFKVVGTSEWDARAIIAYSQIHHQEKFKKKLEKVKQWDEDKIDNYLNERTFSLNSKVPGNPARKHLIFKQNLVAANIVNNNYPDINKIVAEDLEKNLKPGENVDLLTYSFPCQGLSIANMGRAKGIRQDVDSTSNLIWQIKRLLDDIKSKDKKLPKYLLMENVKHLLGKQHIDDYMSWKSYLDEMGYVTYTFILSGLKHRSLQKRERVFGLSILKSKANKLNLNDNLIKKILEEDKRYGRELTIEERKNNYLGILNSNEKSYIEIAIPNNTPSRVKMANENLELIENAEKKKYIFNTLTTKQDRHPNIGMVKLSEEKYKDKGFSHRFITPNEAYQIMGFEKSDFAKVFPKYEEGIITKESLYRQAGNSIVVPVLEDIFKLIHDIDGGLYE